MNSLEVSLIKSQIRAKQLAGVCSAILQGEISLYPPFLEKFEHRYATLVKRRYGLSFCNGTSAIEAALFAANIGPEDEVIVPSCTFHASIDPILNVGATPIFADVDEKTFTLNPTDVKRKLTAKTKAVIVVHLWGIPADMGHLTRLLEDKSILLIEDVSHAHGAQWGGKDCGAFGDFGVFSLQGSKSVAAGEGGIVVTDCWESYIRMSLWGHFNRHAEHFPAIGADSFRWVGVGHKRRMAPLGAILANADLDHLERLNQIKRRNVEILDHELEDLDGIEVSKPSSLALRGGFYQGYPIKVMKEGISAEQVLANLHAVGIEARAYPFALHHQLPIYTDPDFRNALIQRKPVTHPIHSGPYLPVTESLKDKLLLLAPKYLLTLDRFMIERLIKALEI